jgi:transcriptional regulator with XRE-family HTH domain
MNQMVSFGERLREERLRLGKNQTDFGAIAGVTKKTQMLYEAGGRSPDGVYLAAIAAAGTDVLYILTGQRAGGAPALKPDEAALLDNYRHSPKDQQDILKATSDAFAQRQSGSMKQGAKK